MAKGNRTGALLRAIRYAGRCCYPVFNKAKKKNHNRQEFYTFSPIEGDIAYFTVEEDVLVDGMRKECEVKLM